jgi:hypothetical protein
VKIQWTKVEVWYLLHARHYRKCVCLILRKVLHPILRKLETQICYGIIYSQTSRKQKSQDLNPGSLAAKSVLWILNYSALKFLDVNCYSQLPGHITIILCPVGVHVFFTSKIKEESKVYTMSFQYNQKNTTLFPKSSSEVKLRVCLPAQFHKTEPHFGQPNWISTLSIWETAPPPSQCKIQLKRKRNPRPKSRWWDMYSTNLELSSSSVPF